MSVYYNEWDKFAAQRLRNLIAAGHLPAGDVDERSITDVRAADLVGYTSCHFFAGIGGWAYALRLAGWPDDRPIWTGSCPCQPFSAAGKGKGEADERHLWPEFRRLVAECAPAIVFGEQVASAAGRQWLAGVRADLEGLAYAVGAADLCAASTGAPHIRQRIFWLAEFRTTDPVRFVAAQSGMQSAIEERQRLWPDAGQCGDADGMDNANGTERRREARHAFAGTRGIEAGVGAAQPGRPGCGGSAEGMAITEHSRFSGWDAQRPWSSAVVSPGGRRVKPGVRLLVNGLPRSMGRLRVGRVRGYGNAIVPQVAAEFIRAYLEINA